MLNILFLRKSLIHVAFLVACFTIQTQEAKAAPANSQIELHVERYIINHRFGLHALNITLSAQGNKALSPGNVEEDIICYLGDYPNQEDYWEIVNKKILLHLAEKYSGIQQLEITLAVEPNCLIPFPRKSIVKLKHGKIEREAFSFSILNQPLNDDLVHFTIEFDYPSEVSLKDYLDFGLVNNSVQAFINEHSLNKSHGEVPEQLAKYLLDRFSNMKKFGVTLESPPCSCDSMRVLWSATATR